MKDDNAVLLKIDHKDGVFTIHKELVDGSQVLVCSDKSWFKVKNNPDYAAMRDVQGLPVQASSGAQKEIKKEFFK